MLDYWRNGGFGMILVSFFGIALLGYAGRFALGPNPRSLRLALCFLGLTMGSGVLGTVAGIHTTVNYLDRVEANQKFAIFVQGLNESLSNMGLSVALLLFSGILLTVGMFRGGGARPSLG